MVMPLTKSKHTTINVIAKIDENEFNLEMTNNDINPDTICSFFAFKGVLEKVGDSEKPEWMDDFIQSDEPSMSVTSVKKHRK